MLGYRTDIVELLNCADIYVFPSIREGLSVALMEAMASGLPCVVSRIRGNVDLIDDCIGGYLCSPREIQEFSYSLNNLINNKNKRKDFGTYNIIKIQKFDKMLVLDEMRNIYFS